MHPYDLEAATAHIRATEYPSEFEVRRAPLEAAMLESFEAAAVGRNSPQVDGAPD